MMSTSEDFRKILSRFIDKFAGNESELKATFHDLTLDMGNLEAKLDGTVVLNLASITQPTSSDVKLLNMLGQVFKLGEIALSINKAETLQLKVENKQINLDIIDKQFIKKVLSSLGGGKSSLTSSLSQMRNVAEGLRREGFTVAILYQGVRTVTIGEGAKPKLSQIVTGTDAIEINNLFKLIALGV